MKTWRTDRRMRCTAILDGEGQEICFIDLEPASCNGRPCGSVTSQGRTPEELRHITQLISAAPELLEALTGIHKALSRMIYKYDCDSIEAEWLAHSNEAIRKATGHDIVF